MIMLNYLNYRLFSEKIAQQGNLEETWKCDGSSVEGMKKSSAIVIISDKKKNFDTISRATQNALDYRLEFCWDKSSKSNPEDEFDMTKIGRGSFGVVYKAVHKPTGFILCIKVLTEGDEKARKTIDQEIMTLQKLSHSCITAYYGSCNVKDTVWIMMEFCAGGSLEDLLVKLKAKNDQFSEMALKYLILEITKGITYLHNKKHVHRDLKPGNLLLTSKGELKVADFGTAKEVDVATVCNTAAGGNTAVLDSFVGKAPEVVDDQVKYGRKADIWSLGMVILNIADTDHYFSVGNVGVMRIVDALLDPASNFTFRKNPDRWSKELKDFTKQCLQRDPKYRATADNVLHHSYLSDVLDDASKKTAAFQEFQKYFNDYRNK